MTIAFRRQSKPTSDLKIAAVAHVFYEEMWPQLAAHLRNIPVAFSFFASIPDLPSLRDSILRDFPEARIAVTPNIGRDVAPFLEILPRLQGFDAVCKIHTKRNRNWRREALYGVLPDRGTVRRILNAFAADPDLALVGSKLFYLDGPSHRFLNEEYLLRYLGTLPRAYGFFGGTIFWVRPSLLAGLQDIVPLADFRPHKDVDGHAEHAVERVIGARAAIQDRKVGLIDIGWLGQPRLEIVPATFTGELSFRKSLRRLRKRAQPSLI